MIKSELKDGIVWLTVVGKLTAEDVKREAGKWLPQKDTFSGYITDLRMLTSSPSIFEREKLEEWRKQNESGKPHAMLGTDNVMASIIKAYIRITGAKDTRYFTDVEEAIAWVKSFDQQSE
jgi:hypothetical protein